MSAYAPTIGDRVMRTVPGGMPDGPWVVRADLTNTRGTWLLEHPDYPATATACAVTVQAYAATLSPVAEATA